MRKPSTAHRSRRAPPLKDSDYDHEINLVDHAAEAVTPQALSPEPGQQPASTTHPHPQPEPASEQDPEPEAASGEGPSSSQRAPARDRSLQRSTSSASGTSRVSKKVSKKAASQESLAGDAAVPQVEVTGENLHKSTRTVARHGASQISDRQQNLHH